MPGLVGGARPVVVSREQHARNVLRRRQSRRAADHGTLPIWPGHALPAGCFGRRSSANRRPLSRSAPATRQQASRGAVFGARARGSVPRQACRYQRCRQPYRPRSDIHDCDRPSAATAGSRHRRQRDTGWGVGASADRKDVPAADRSTPVAPGTEFDARQGTAQLSAAGSNGATQTGTLSGAVFKLSQGDARRTRGLITVSLIDGAFSGAPSYAGCQKHSTRVLQTWHATVNGQFQIRGRYSAATGRTGQWATSDRCDGTRTVVHRGTVSVTQVGRHCHGCRARRA